MVVVLEFQRHSSMFIQQFSACCMSRAVRPGTSVHSMATLRRDIVEVTIKGVGSMRIGKRGPCPAKLVRRCLY